MAGGTLVHTILTRYPVLSQAKKKHAMFDARFFTWLCLNFRLINRSLSGRWLALASGIQGPGRLHRRALFYGPLTGLTSSLLCSYAVVGKIRIRRALRVGEHLFILPVFRGLRLDIEFGN